MSERYLTELNNLGAVYKAALSIDISDLADFVESISLQPLTAIGSGGSFSSAVFAATLHEHFCHEIARACTPLEVLSNPSTRGAALCLSASGRNRDIGAAFKSLCLSEAGPIGGLVMKSESPLHAIARQYELAKVFSASDTSFKDGFLAVATMVASAILVTRSYEVALGGGEKLPPSLELLALSTIGESDFHGILSRIGGTSEDKTISVIYTTATKPAAVDLESRFVEAALGNLHIADLRNFGHGRHHWLAKRGEQTSVFALIGSDWGKLASRTLDYLPERIPIHRIDLKGHFAHQSLTALILGLFISLGVGRSVGIDPGKPGVPEFGRRLYRLGPGPLRTKQSQANRQIAIKRKLPSSNQLNTDDANWGRNYDLALKRLARAEIGGVVFDFDGTLCRIEDRFEPLPTDVSVALNDLLSTGLLVGIATGRGPSAGQRLREGISQQFWDGIVVGYYNAGCITKLSNTLDPLLEDTSDDQLSLALSANGQFQYQRMRSNAAQITMHLERPEDVGFAVSAIEDIAHDAREVVKIVSSGHSIDILRKGQSKTNVVSELANNIKAKGREILRIGDKGRWPGNDAEFLDSPFGLSVDQVSHHPDNCWNFAPAGIRGVQATLYYMKALEIDGGKARLILRPGDKGKPRAA